MVKPWSHSKRFAILLAGLSALVCACAFVLGCSRPTRMHIAPVRGQVTYQGKPIAGATVEFLCPGASRPSYGTTDGQGNYRLTTFKESDGAMIGSHVVTVNVYSSESEESLPSAKGTDSKAMSKAIDEAVRKSAQSQQAAAKTGPPIPKKYTERQTSNLRKEVVAGDNVINIELVD